MEIGRRSASAWERTVTWFSPTSFMNVVCITAFPFTATLASAGFGSKLTAKPWAEVFMKPSAKFISANS